MGASNGESVLRVKNLNLVFRVNVYPRQTIREVFVELARKPFDVLFPEPDRLQVAQNISFEVGKGERVGLLGVNGSGKTSLCRCITGMYRPTSGKIEVQGRTRAIFSTQVGIQPDLTGRENAELLVHFLYPGLSRKEALKTVDEALDFSELGRFTETPFRLYSNGMQTRLSLSLVSARPTDLLILDEVFDGADSFFREKISVRVQKMIEESGAALFVSHSPDQILKVCTRVIVLSRSKIVFDGTPENALEFYESLSPANQNEKIG